MCCPGEAKYHKEARARPAAAFAITWCLDSRSVSGQSQLQCHTVQVLLGACTGDAGTCFPGRLRHACRLPRHLPPPAVCFRCVLASKQSSHGTLACLNTSSGHTHAESKRHTQWRSDLRTDLSSKLLVHAACGGRVADEAPELEGGERKALEELIGWVRRSQYLQAPRCSLHMPVAQQNRSVGSEVCGHPAMRGHVEGKHMGSCLRENLTCRSTCGSTSVRPWCSGCPHFSVESRWRRHACML